MAIFHPIVNIEINKSYCLREYSNKKIHEQRLKLKELSEDKTGWSIKVMNTIKIIINDLQLDLPDDIVESHINTLKTINYSLGKDISQFDKKELDKKVHDILDNNVPGEDNVVQTTDEVYLSSNPKYTDYNDIRMAHLILLLSNLAKLSNILWVTVTMRIQELRNLVLYFISEDGHIRLSEKSAQSKDTGIQDYIDSLNEIIDGKREVPR